MPIDKPQFSVAIIGGGVAGMTLTIALAKRGIDVRIYEQAPQFTEIGAGIAFSPNAKQAMEQCDPLVHEAYLRVATSSGSPDKINTWYDFVDSYTGSEQWLFDVTRDAPADGCHRAHFLEEMIKLVPEGVAQFNKHLDKIMENGRSNPLTLNFSDGTTAEADIVIGSDGIKSSVRGILFGQDAPEAKPTYTHRYAYRGLLNMDNAIKALGKDLATNRTMHMGQDGHVLTFPVAHGKILNVVAFRYDTDEWTDARLVVPTTKESAKQDFKDWGAKVRALLDLLEDKLDKWAIFDLGDHPLPTYAKGRVAVIGDAAHATGPHHGAGAGICIEDSAILAELLHTAWNRLEEQSTKVAKTETLEKVLEVFDAVRRERTQWLVQSSRDSVELYEWRDRLCKRDPAKLKEQILWRNHKIWRVDIRDMVAEANRKLEEQIV
ncbi:FAD/NAD(P)-binding domain-containing protein [Aureobasidium namibiae CBS 147.97]|uniref:FAD/NAD(P)-binding domain-containing protein n=1 Tax=Aureobasidium namibiae CBS 147.97 TaxID=1043004 RepID=A0A074WPV3_9PEZI